MPTVIEVPPQKPTSIKKLVPVVLLFDLVLAAIIWSTSQFLYFGLLVVSTLPLFFARQLHRKAQQQQIARIEVTDTLVTSVHWNGTTKCLSREGGNVIRVKPIGSGLFIQVIGDGMEQSLFPVRNLNVARLREAAHAHGWSFQDGEHGPVETPSASFERPDPVPAKAEGTTLVLREGMRRMGSPSTLTVLLIGLGFLPVVIAMVTGEVNGPLMEPWLILPWIIFLGVVRVVLYIVLQARSVTIGPDQVTYKSGTNVHTARRVDTVAVTIGSKWIKFTTESRPPRVWLPVKWRRDEILGLLRANGWPLQDL